MFLPSANRNRIGDLAYLTHQQLKEQEDLFPSVSTFVLEIISKNDKADEIRAIFYGWCVSRLTNFPKTKNGACLYCAL